MLIAIDMDDVLADFMGAFLRRLGSWVGREVLREEIVDWNFGAHTEAAHELMHQLDRRFYSNLPVVAGAMDVVIPLVEQESVVIVTDAISGMALDGKRDWLYWNDLSKVPLVATAHKRLIRADWAIDDACHNADAYRAAGVECLLFDQPWNQVGEYRRVRSWKEIGDVLCI